MKAIRFIAVLTSIAFGCWLGGYVMLYGGIVQAVNACQADPINAGQIAGGIIRALFCECGFVAGGIIAFGANWCLEGDW